MGFGKSVDKIGNWGKSAGDSIKKGFNKAEKQSGKLLNKSDEFLKKSGKVMQGLSSAADVVGSMGIPGVSLAANIGKGMLDTGGKRLEQAGRKIERAKDRREELIEQKKTAVQGFKNAYK